MGRETLLYSNRTATGMVFIPNDYPTEAMRSAMNFDADSKHVRWNMSALQRKVHHRRNPQEGAPQRLHVPHTRGSRDAWNRTQKNYELIVTGELPTIRVGRAVRISASALRKWVEVADTRQLAG